MGGFAWGGFKFYPDIIIRIHLKFFRAIPFQEKTECVELTMCQDTERAGCATAKYITGFKLLYNDILQHITCFILNFSPYIELLGKSRKAEKKQDDYMTGPLQ